MYSLYTQHLQASLDFQILISIIIDLKPYSTLSYIKKNVTMMTKY